MSDLSAVGPGSLGEDGEIKVENGNVSVTGYNYNSNGTVMVDSSVPAGSYNYWHQYDVIINIKDSEMSIDRALYLAKLVRKFRDAGLTVSLPQITVTLG